MHLLTAGGKLAQARGGAARDLAAMAMYIRRAPGIMAEELSPAEAAARW